MQASVSTKTKVCAAYELGFTSCATGVYNFLEKSDFEGALQFIDKFFEKGSDDKNRVLREDKVDVNKISHEAFEGYENTLQNILDHKIDERVR